MKKVFCLYGLFLSFSINAKATDSSFTLIGQLDEIKSGTIFLTIHGDEEQQFSSKIFKGEFKFTGYIKKASDAVLEIKNKQQDYFLFFIEPGEMHISGKGSPVRDLIISNSPLNDDDKVLRQQMEPVQKWELANANAYEEAVKTKNKKIVDSLDRVDFEVLKEKRKMVSMFVKDHPHSLRSAMAIKENYAYYAEADEVEPLYNLLDDEIKTSSHGQDVKKMIEVYKSVAVGMMAPDIMQTTPQGSLLSLSSLKGKYVLVDFWASWCGPCRRENPNVVLMYNEYKSKPFDIFSVSYDSKKDKWEKAIKDDGLAWHHVSDLQGWKNATSALYGIRAIPSNLLLNKEGRIIAKNVFGEKLSSLLNDVIK